MGQQISTGMYELLEELIDERAVDLLKTNVAETDDSDHSSVISVIQSSSKWSYC
ncbi:hypothetical protein PRUPE_1G219200 [Prunus persica]|uniref:Uncharacterized protein n=1 Tax=Prunus persica TaxID=3760 RepID=A0A251R2H4_PRUPE|nr:hypothetical protein PRUPE_1G219200 [Prunus persica]